MEAWRRDRELAKRWARLQTPWTRWVRGSAFGRLPADATDEQVELMRAYGEALRGRYGQAVSALNGVIYAVVFQTFFWGWRDRDAPLPWGWIAALGFASALAFALVSAYRLRSRGVALETAAERVQAHRRQRSE